MEAGSHLTLFISWSHSLYVVGLNFIFSLALYHSWHPKLMTMLYRVSFISRTNDRAVVWFEGSQSGFPLSLAVLQMPRSAHSFKECSLWAFPVSRLTGRHSLCLCNRFARMSFFSITEGGASLKHKGILGRKRTERSIKSVF